MRKNLIRAGILATCLGAAVGARAQPPGQYQPGGMPSDGQQQTSPDATYDQRAPAAYPSQQESGRPTLARPTPWTNQTPASGIDSTAYTQCHGLTADEYWDCVNSHDGGGGQ